MWERCCRAEWVGSYSLSMAVVQDPSVHHFPSTLAAEQDDDAHHVPSSITTRMEHGHANNATPQSHSPFPPWNTLRSASPYDFSCVGYIAQTPSLLILRGQDYFTNKIYTLGFIDGRRNLPYSCV